MEKDLTPDEIIMAPLLERIPEAWGKWISCPKGWYPLLLELDTKIARIAPTYEIHQVKEKFWTLRFYFEYPEGLSEQDAQEIDALVREAELLSAHICIECGEPGKQMGSGYQARVLCETCSSIFQNNN